MLAALAAMVLGLDATAPPPALRRVDQGVADTDPLAVSLRDMRVDLAVPAGFRDLFVPEGRDDLFVRRDGALWATFRRSTYLRTERGTLPLVPPGTVFSIGVPRELMDAQADAPDATPPRAEWIDARTDDLLDPGRLREEAIAALDLRVDGAPAPTPDGSPKGSPSAPTASLLVASGGEFPEPLPRFVADEEYRRARLKELVRGVR